MGDLLQENEWDFNSDSNNNKKTVTFVTVFTVLKKTKTISAAALLGECDGIPWLQAISLFDFHLK